jgi:hypothetical protein
MDTLIFGALRELLTAAPMIQKSVFIVGGTALWDWWYATEPTIRRSGGILEEPRITKDIDVGVERRTLQVAGDPVALRDALTENGWVTPHPHAFSWSNLRWEGITIEPLVQKEPGDKPGSVVWIRDEHDAKVVRACATLTRLGTFQDLLEECRHESISEFRIARFSQLGLLLSKIIAVANVLSEFRAAERENRSPKAYCERLGKDRHDALLLLGVAVRRGITGLAARKAMDHHRTAIDDDLAIVAQAGRLVPKAILPQDRSGVTELAYAIEQWLAEV